MMKPLTIGLVTFLFSTTIFANPVMDNVAAGQVSVSQTTNTTVVNQASQKAIINWRSFNIGADDHTHFQQPQGGVALNRINPSQGASQIFGRLTATGQIILVNPAGVFFASGSYVNVGGLIATTMNITDQDFLNGYYHFSNSPGYNGAVINRGTIIAAEHGLVALIGGAVSNEGMIQANMGHVVLAAGNAATMTFAGNDLISFTVDSGVNSRAIDKDGHELRDGVTNTGSLIANGGSILVTAKDAAAVLDNVINMRGYAQTHSVDDGAHQHDGEIILWGDPNGGVMKVGGQLAASSGTIIAKSYDLQVEDGASFDVSSALRDGGFIETSGTHGLILGNLAINTAAPNGKAGTWLIDPADLNITTVDANVTGSTPYEPTAAGATLNVATLTAALALGNVIVQTNFDGFGGSGNITVSSGITWTSANTLLLQAYNNIIINAPISGINGSLHLTAVNAAASITTGASGTIDVNNFNLLQGQWHQVGSLPAFNVRNYFQINSGVIPNAATQFIRASSGDGTISTPYVLTDVYGLQGIASNTTTLSQNFIVGSNIDASSTATWNNNTGFIPIGNNTNQFSGTLNGFYSGQNHTIDSLYFNSAAAYIGLFGSITSAATLSNLGLTNVVIAQSTPAPTAVGALTAANYGGSINNTYVTGTMTLNGGTNLGGLVGLNNGTIANSHSAMTITGIATANIGGLVGNNNSSAVFGNGNITDSYNSGNINIQTGSGAFLGGLVGLNTSLISNTYNSGLISQHGSAGIVGGLVGGDGQANIQASVTFSFNTGNVSNYDGLTGGVVGQHNYGLISNTYNSGIIASRFNLGGIVGSADNNSIITNSYNVGIIASGYGYAGGIAGITNNSSVVISNTYNAGPVFGLTRVGALVGTNSGNITNSFFDSQTSIAQNAIGFLVSGGITGSPSKTTAEMMSSATFTSTWGTSTGATAGGITNIASTTATAPDYTWFIFEGSTRPILMMENKSVITNVHELQMMGAALNGSYQLGNNIDATNTRSNNADIWATDTTINGSGFVPVGNSSNLFTGAFNGNQYTINNLYINATNQNTGMFGSVNSTGNFRDVNLTNVNINLTINNSSNYYVGGFIGATTNAEQLSGIMTSGSIIGSGNVNFAFAGGLVGSLSSSTVLSDSFSLANVRGTADVGGLVAQNLGSVSRSYFGGSAYTSSTTSQSVGGLVGQHNGTIANSYSYGSVTSSGSSVSANVGGLVGNNAGTITNAYSSGLVSGRGNLGGFVGAAQAGAVNNSFWDMASSGQTAGYGIGSSGNISGGLSGGCFGNTSCGTPTNSTNVSAVNLALLNTYVSAGWSVTSTASSTATAPANTWFIFENNSRPLLMMENNSSVATAHALQMMAVALDGSYTLTNNIELSSPLNNTADVWGGQQRGFLSIGASGNEFTGSLDGQSYQIQNMFINLTASNASNKIGLFGATSGASLSNFGVTNFNISIDSATNNSEIGGVVGYANNTMLNRVYTTGTLTMPSGAGNAIGGMIGNASNVTITNSHNLANINITGNSSNTGGLVGWLGNSGSNNTITTSYNGGNIAVSGTGNALGGLIGYLDAGGSIDNTYNYGSVTVGGNTSGSGGLIGVINSGTVNHSYSSGLVTIGSGTAGGLIGVGGSTANSFWDTNTSGQLSSAGGTGKTTAELILKSTYVGWDIVSDPSRSASAPNNVWFIFNGPLDNKTYGYTRPMLMMENTSIITNAHELQMMTAATGGNYTIANDIEINSGMNNLADVWVTNRSTNTGAGFVPGASNVSFFSGTLNGQHYAISDLYINGTNNPAQFNQENALFGFVEMMSVMENIYFKNPTVISGPSGWNDAPLIGRSEGNFIRNVLTDGGSIYATFNSDLSGVVGEIYGGTMMNITVKNMTFTNVDTGIDWVGAIAGFTLGATLINVQSLNNVMNGSGSRIGGVVGMAIGNSVIKQAYNSSTINGVTQVGGIVGYMSGSTLINAYNVGTVTASGTSPQVGGIVGFADATSTISNALNSGVVSGVNATDGTVGGLVGWNNGGTLTNSFWDVDTSGTTASINPVGLNSGTLTAVFAGCFSGACTTSPGSINSAYLFGGTTLASLSNIATYTSTLTTNGGTAWDITSTPSTTSAMPANNWFIFEGGTRPMLRLELSDSISDTHQLQLMGAALGGNYTLANNIDFSTTNASDIWGSNFNTGTGTGFMPIGTTALSFTGSLDGQNYIINKFYINRPNLDWVGVIGRQRGGTIANLAMTNVNVTGRYQVGGMIGGSSGALSNLSVRSGSVVGSQNLSVVNPDGGGNTIVGGLIGWLYSPGSTLTNSYNHASVSGYVMAGGLVGDVHGRVTNSFSTGNVTGPNGAAGLGGLVGYINSGLISSSYSTGSVTVNGAGSYLGGLLGGNLDVGATITNSYSTGAVITGAGSNRVGGLIGAVTLSGGSISNSYSTGYVYAPSSSNVGGLIGSTAIPATNSFWDTQTSGLATSAGGAGVVGKTTIEMMTPSTFSAWNNTTTWNMLSGQSYPYLRAFYSSTTQAISGSTSAAPNSVITLAVAGVVTQTANTGANGFFYQLNGYNNISQVDNRLTGGVALLAYESGSTTTGNVVTTLPLSYGSVSGIYDALLNPVGNGLIFTANTVTAGNSGTTSVALNNSLMAAARGALVDSGILYSGTGSNLSHTAGKSFMTTTATTYTLDNDISVTNANITMNGAVIIGASAPALSTITSGDIIINNTVDLGSNALTINTAGSNSSVSGVISNTGSITKAGSGLLTLSGNNTYGGLTTIANGTLRVTHANALGSTAQGSSVGASGTLNIDNVSVGAETVALNGGALNGTGTASLLGDVTLNADSNISNTGGNFTLSGTINGNFGLALDGLGTTVLNGNVGNLASGLGSITGNSSISVGGGLMRTSGNQSYQNIVTLTDDATFTMTGAGTNIMTFTSNITGSGAENLFLTGTGTGNYQFNVSEITANNVDVTASTLSSNNLLALNVSSGMNINITGVNSGNITGASNVAGTFNFNRIQNLTGGAGLDVFNFANGASISGNINGGDTVNRNNIRLNNYGGGILMLLNMPTNNEFDAGSVYDANNTLIANFSQIQQSDGNNLGSIILPANKNISVVYYDKTYLNGEIGDPFYFYGWAVGNRPPISPPSNALNPAVAPIVNQPITNSENNDDNESTNNYGMSDYDVENRTLTAVLLDTSSVQAGKACQAVIQDESAGAICVMLTELPKGQH